MGESNKKCKQKCSIPIKTIKRLKRRREIIINVNGNQVRTTKKDEDYDGNDDRRLT